MKKPAKRLSNGRDRSHAALCCVVSWTALLLVLAACRFAAPSDREAVEYPEFLAIHGSQGSGTVLLICQGGPAFSLTYLREGRTNYRYLPGYANYEVAYVHQAQTLDAAVLDRGLGFDNGAAAEATDVSVNYLLDAASWYRSRGYKVLVVGHSYGAFIVLNALSVRGQFADQYVLSAARLDVPWDMVSEHLEGVSGEFEPDGETYSPYRDDGEEYSLAERGSYNVRSRLKAAIGSPRYTRELADLELSNLSFFFAENDTRGASERRRARVSGESRSDR